MSLVEVLVSLVVFSIGVLGVVGLQARAVQYSVDAEDRNRAALLVNDIVSQMWLQQTVSLDKPTITAWQTRVRDAAVSGLPNAAATIGEADANGVVSVTITWRSPSKRTADGDSRYTTQVVLP